MPDSAFVVSYPALLQSGLAVGSKSKPVILSEAEGPPIRLWHLLCRSHQNHCISPIIRYKTKEDIGGPSASLRMTGFWNRTRPAALYLIFHPHLYSAAFQHSLPAMPRKRPKGGYQSPFTQHGVRLGNAPRLGFTTFTIHE